MRPRVGIAVLSMTLLFIMNLILLGVLPMPFHGAPEPPVTSAVNLTWSEPELVHSETIAETGGIVEITDSATELKGLRIEVPDEATDEAITFSIHTAPITQVQGVPSDVSIASPLIQLSASGSPAWNEFRTFDEPVLLTLPYDDAPVSANDVVRFYYYDDAAKVLEAAGFLWEDPGNHTITFYAGTFSGSLRIAYFALRVSLGEMSYESLFNSGFVPASDGWYIPNTGSYLRPAGNCMGMTAYAKWYYTYKLGATGTPLSAKYIEGDPNEWRDDATAIQLATRAQMGAVTVFNNINLQGLKVPKGCKYSSHSIAYTLFHGLYVSKSPQFVQLKTQLAGGDIADGKHMVLVYGYSGGRFLVYDPNHPREVKSIPFTFSGGFSETYKTGSAEFNIFMVTSAQTYGPTAFWSGLYDAAETKFQDASLFPTVTLTSTPLGSTPDDTDGDNIRDTAESTATITGSITGGQRAISSTLLFINNQKYRVSVQNGQFTKQVPLLQGDNHLVVLATDENTRTNWAGYHQDIITCTATKAALTIKLDWTQPNSDLDLHVLEPTIDGQAGRHIYYQNKGTPGQYPYLNIDNTREGPEHYYAHQDNTLPNADPSSPVLYGTYQVRVHYYADHDDDVEHTQVIDWTLTFRYLAFRIEALNKDFWVQETRSGRLTIANTVDTNNFLNPDASWSTIWRITYPEPDPTKYTIPPPPQNTFPD